MFWSFSGKEASREAEIQQLRAKVGELMIERDSFLWSSVVEPRPKSNDDPAERSPTQHHPSVLIDVDGPLVVLLRTPRREPSESRTDAPDRRAVPRYAVLRLAPNDTLAAEAGQNVKRCLSICRITSPQAISPRARESASRSPASGLVNWRLPSR